MLSNMKLLLRKMYTSTLYTTLLFTCPSTAESPSASKGCRFCWAANKDGNDCIICCSELFLTRLECKKDFLYLRVLVVLPSFCWAASAGSRVRDSLARFSWIVWSEWFSSLQPFCFIKICRINLFFFSRIPFSRWLICSPVAMRLMSCTFLVERFAAVYAIVICSRKHTLSTYYKRNAPRLTAETTWLMTVCVVLWTHNKLIIQR